MLTTNMSERQVLSGLYLEQTRIFGCTFQAHDITAIALSFISSSGILKSTQEILIHTVIEQSPSSRCRSALMSAIQCQCHPKSRPFLLHLNGKLADPENKERMLLFKGTIFRSSSPLCHKCLEIEPCSVESKCWLHCKWVR